MAFNHPGNDLKDVLMNRAMSGSQQPQTQPKASGYSTVSSNAAAPAPQTSPAGVPNYDTMPKAPTGLPAPVPSKSNALPPAWQRYATAQKMQNAVANSWSPNPMLIRLLDHD